MKSSIKSMFLVLLLSFVATVSYANSGDILWENYFDREDKNGDDIADKVAACGNKVFVVGLTVTDANAGAFSVRAYNAINGSLLWEDHFDREGKGRDWANAVAVEDNRVFAVGYTESASGISAFSVRAYDTNTGTLLWEDYFDREGTGGDGASAVAVKNKRVFVTGHTRTKTGGGAFSIRAYSK